MVFISIRAATASFDVDLRREQSYNIGDLQSYVQLNIPKLTREQKDIYDRIMQIINDGFGGIFFLDAPGGTGKTFLIRLILAMIRSKNDIALALASTGIAATLLPGGRTAHSALKLPLNMQIIDTPMCYISKASGMPPHIPKLKIGVPIIMLRNINQPKLCNGTRLAVKQLLNNVVEATILPGHFKGKDVLIPRIPMIPTDTPFQFKRLQLPIRLAFAITINKSQGQSLEMCGLDLDVDCFSHGQLYVACSRVGKPNSLYIYSNNGKTKNIVYPQVLQN